MSSTDDKPLVHTAKDFETPRTLPFDEAQCLLETGEVQALHGLMRFGSNYTFLVDVASGDDSLLAIYKPHQGERPLWDFPDGTLGQREVASSIISTMLGWYIVPPTLLKEGEHGLGSVQLFIEHDPDRHYYNFTEAHLPQLQRVALFDAIINNTDRKGGHCLLDETDRIWGIDQGLSFHVAPKLRTVIWDFAGQPIPQALMDDIVRLCEWLTDESRQESQQLSVMITVSEITALRRRVERLIERATFPMPGRGPNQPWPAI